MSKSSTLRREVVGEWTEAKVREGVRAFLDEHWSAEASLVEWRGKLADSGWGCPTWPVEWHGLEIPENLAPPVGEEFARVGAVGIARAGIRLLVAATLLEHGGDAHKRQFLRRILTGEDTWCQLFSEPGSGSDLAGATTRAERDGDDWIVNGQKVWTTSAHDADWGLLLARTDWDLPKHLGLTCFVIDMRQNGIAVQPLRQMNHHASFNQVFFTDAHVPGNLRIGNEGDGWKVAMTTLAHERRNADRVRGEHVRADRTGRIYDELRVESATVSAPYSWYPQRAGRTEWVLARALETGRFDDPVIRQEIAALLSLHKTAEWTARRARAAQQLGRPQGPEGSLGKLAGSEVARRAAHVHTLLSGGEALLKGPEGPRDGLIAEILLSVPATSIAGGTDEIQRNIIAERVLGMPREPRFDGGPFRDVAKN